MAPPHCVDERIKFPNVKVEYDIGTGKVKIFVGEKLVFFEEGELVAEFCENPLQFVIGLVLSSVQATRRGAVVLEGPPASTDHCDAPMRSYLGERSDFEDSPLPVTPATGEGALKQFLGEIPTDEELRAGVAKAEADLLAQDAASLGTDVFPGER